MSNQGIKNNDVNGTGAFSCEGVASGMHGVPDLASAGRHQATDQTKERIKWAKAVNKMVIECWTRSEPTKRKYMQRMKKIWDEIGVLPVTKQRLADQARQIRNIDIEIIDIEIEEIRWQLKRNNNKVKVQEKTRKYSNTTRISRVNRKSKGHKKSWFNKDIRICRSRKHTTLVHFQKMMKY